MAKFVYLYTGGQQPETPEAQEQNMKDWGSWLGGLGESVADMGNPFGASASVSASGAGGQSGLGVGGYTIVNFDSLADATAKAAGCPVFQGGGSVEIYEAVPM